LLQARVAIATADRVVVLSREDERFLARRSSGLKGNVVRIANGVGSEFFDPERVRNGGPPRILFVGSWIDRKGINELVAAYAALAETNAVELVLAGTGISADDVLEAFPAAHRSNVRVIARLDARELRVLHAACDLFVLPSWFEGMPLSVLEAAASGLPLVLSSTCGNIDIVRPASPENDGGLLVSPGDVDGLCNALRRLVRDPELREQMGQRAQTRAREFTWDRSVEALERAYCAAASHPTVHGR
jgi:glycosyltransferase involved in cell wall biosynthesis